MFALNFLERQDTLLFSIYIIFLCNVITSRVKSHIYQCLMFLLLVFFCDVEPRQMYEWVNKIKSLL